MKYSEFKHLYTLEEGDKWCWIEDEIIITNPNKIPFSINLETGEKKIIEFNTIKRED